VGTPPRLGGERIGVFFERQSERLLMVTRPVHLGSYEFVAVCALRAQQLLAGSVPRAPGEHAAATMAQMEVAGGFVTRAAPGDPDAPVQCNWQL
jgi:hypothetical protein